MNPGEEAPLKFIRPSAPKYPGATYVEGLRAIMEKRSLGVDEAAEVCKQSMLDNGGYEHLAPLYLAIKYVKWEDSQKKSPNK